MKNREWWWVTAVTLLMLLFLMSSWDFENHIEDLEKVIAKQQQMIARDEKILNALLHGTWDRDCVYEIIPGELLADGSVRESMIQHCED